MCVSFEGKNEKRYAVAVVTDAWCWLLTMTHDIDMLISECWHTSLPDKTTQKRIVRIHSPPTYRPDLIVKQANAWWVEGLGSFEKRTCKITDTKGYGYFKPTLSSLIYWNAGWSDQQRVNPELKWSMKEISRIVSTHTHTRTVCIVNK